MHIGSVVEYAGTGFSGSQFQPNARTVQGDLEIAAGKVFKTDLIRFRMASRTDAGVHATGQVASFTVDTGMNTIDVRNAMNANLYKDIQLRHVVQVPASFDPRRDARFREYRYVINDDQVSSPINSHLEYHVRSPLDVDAMNIAAHLFLGSHDFAAFAASTVDKLVSTVRHVDTARVERRASDGRIIFCVRANAFVRQQIRRMAAMLIAIGNGSAEPSRISHHLNHPIRGAASQNAPAKGLTLTKIGYDEESASSEFPILSTVGRA